MADRTPAFYSPGSIPGTTSFIPFTTGIAGGDGGATALQVVQGGAPLVPALSSMASGDTLLVNSGGSGGATKQVVGAGVSGLGAAVALASGNLLPVSQDGVQLLASTVGAMATYIGTVIAGLLQQPTLTLSTTVSLDKSVNAQTTTWVAANSSVKLPTAFANAGDGYYSTFINDQGFTVSFTDPSGTLLTTGANGNSTTGFLTTSTGAFTTTAGRFTVYARSSGTKFYVAIG